MNSAEERREAILNILNDAKGHVSASSMSQQLSVSRQVIVSDIAILRERGNNIVSSPFGYYLGERADNGYVDTVVCLHDASRILDEFNAVVDNGGVVLDVVIEHAIYGQISAQLNIYSRYEAEVFNKKIAEGDALPLSATTGGYHFHRIKTRSYEDFQRICDALRELGILCEE